MLEDLCRDPMDPNTRTRLQKRLRAGPWCWPIDPEQRTCAERLVRDGPEARPGGALLVSLRENVASLWALAAPGELEGALVRVDFVDDALDAWSTAGLVLPLAVPVLWRSVEAEVRRRPRAVWLGSYPPDAPESALKGTSFGLAFLLGLASRVFRLAVPADLAALASVDRRGRIWRVSGLPAKLRAIGTLAPTVRRVVVGAGWEDGVERPDEDRLIEEEAGRHGLAIHSLSQASTAVTYALGGEEPLAAALVGAGVNEATRRRLTDLLFELALGGRGQNSEWGSVRAAAELAIKAWPKASDPRSHADAQRLSTAAAIAARHERNGGAMPLPEDEWLAAFAVPLRLRLVAHAVQQSTDSGAPDPDSVLALAQSFMVEGPEAFKEHLTLKGAVARLLAVRGQPELALKMQEEVALGLMERLASQEASRNLSEWLRLSGALSDRGAFQRALEFEERVLDRGGFDPNGMAYVDLARCRALVAGLGEVDPTPLLRRLTDTAAPAFVRGSASRWLACALEAVGAPDEADDVLRELAATASDSKLSEEVRPFVCLARLDRALVRADHEAILGALGELGELQPGIVEHLRHAVDGRDLPPYVARFFPY